MSKVIISLDRKLVKKVDGFLAKRAELFSALTHAKKVYDAFAATATKPMLDEIEKRKVAKREADDKEKAKRDRAWTKEVKVLKTNLEEFGVANLFMERYAAMGFCLALVYRPNGQRTNPGYEISKLEGVFSVSLCRGPGNPSSAEFTKPMKKCKTLEEVVSYLKTVKI